MKIFFIMRRGSIALGLLFALSCVSAGPAGGGRFGKLTFSDEFDGPAVDANKWYVKAKAEGNWPDMPWRRNYKKENAYLEDGALVLRTVREGSEAAPVFSTGWAATAEAGRPKLFEQAYGRFEARVQFPSQPGHWCAFWLMPDTVGRVDGSGRDGTEIDIMEKAWTFDRVQHALHWDGYREAHRSADRKLPGLGMNDGGWHVFRLDWYPDEYVFFVDNIETWRTSAGGVSRAPAHIILSEEIGNSGRGPDAWGEGPIADAVLPDYFRVDYVRVWKYLPPGE